MATSLQIPPHEVQRRLALDNPWWKAGHGIDPEEESWPRRAYFRQFSRLVREAAAAGTMNLSAVVAKTTEIVVQQTIDIPRIAVVPRRAIAASTCSAWTSRPGWWWSRSSGLRTAATWSCKPSVMPQWSPA